MPSKNADSAWSPLRQPVFRALWIAQFASNIGSWMQTVGAQWLLIAHGAALLSLVQVAAGLPVLVLALPAGVLADLVDRRRLLLAVQGGMAAVAVVLAVLAFAGHLGPWTLLALTLLLGFGHTIATSCRRTSSVYGCVSTVKVTPRRRGLGLDQRAHYELAQRSR